MRVKIFAITVLCAALAGCRDGGENAETPDVPTFDVDYSFTRVDGTTGKATDKDTYTMMSYMVKDASGINITTDLDVMASADRRGYYAYVENGTAGYVEDDFLVPFAPRYHASDNRYYPYLPASGNIARTNDNGQKLAAGTYKTAMITPAVEVRSAGLKQLGTYLAVLWRDVTTDKSQPVYASLPGDPTKLNGELFEIKVEKNLTIYDVPSDIELYTLWSMINVYFYSTTGSDYQISEIKFINLGSTGWFNPYTGKTYPNYNYTTPTTYQFNDNPETPPQFDPSDWKVSDIKDPVSGEALGNVPYVKGPADEEYEIGYWAKGETVYASDYRGADKDGDPYVKPIVLRITVSMPRPGWVPTDPPAEEFVSITNELPIALDMKRGKVYNFFFDIQSSLFNISYNVTGWDVGSDDPSADIGDVQKFETIPFTQSGGWDIENGGDTPGDIGD